MTRFILILLALVTLLGCQEPFLGDGEDEMAYKGWSASGTLTSYDTQKSVTLQANFLEGTSISIGASNYTVQFSVSVQSGFLINPVAEIVWSVEGNTVRRKVSVVDGLAVTGVGQGCRVKVYDEPAADMFPVAVDYEIAIQIVPGARPATQQVPFYTPIIDNGVAGSEQIGYAVIAAGANLDVPIPLGIGITSIYVTANGTAVPIVLTSANLAVDLIDPIGAVLVSYNPINIGWVPLPPQAQVLRLNNYIGGGGSALLYHVWFGIDG
jgi:hypothetical protein